MAHSLRVWAQSSSHVAQLLWDLWLSSRQRKGMRGEGSYSLITTGAPKTEKGLESQYHLQDHTFSDLTSSDYAEG